MLQDVLRIEVAVFPDAGEDSCALRLDEQGAFLCVTDGCGGLGSKRYGLLDNRTGAYLAARLVQRCFTAWAEERRPLPQSEEEAQILCREAERALFDCLSGFAAVHCREEGSRITGTMQRCLPSTICAATISGNEAGFWWAGDSRGYVMDEDGLRQYTRDHLRGDSDAFETLYRDAPLANLISADKVGRIHSKRIKFDKPCLVLTVTDGVYSALPSPMEMEMLLLDTLKQARGFADWQKKLQKQIASKAQDDATMLMAVCGYDDFALMKETLLKRRESLQKQFITPLRRHKGDMTYAREKWRLYKTGYDCTEENHE